MVELEGNSPQGTGIIDVDAIMSGSQESPSSGDNSAYIKETLESLSSPKEGQDASEDMSECPICLDVMDRPMLLPGCLHKWYVPVVRCKHWL